VVGHQQVGIPDLFIDPDGFDEPKNPVSFPTIMRESPTTFEAS
jgi:hypothetical protein